MKKMKLCAITITAATSTMLCAVPIFAHEITGSTQHALVRPPQGNIFMDLFATAAMFGILGVSFIAIKNKD